jgi:hypothetical protein
MRVQEIELKKNHRVIGVGFDGSDIQKILDEELKKSRQPVTFTALESLPRTFRHSIHKIRNKDVRFVKIYGAAGDEEIPETKLKAISDPLTAETRKQITDTMLSDPIIAPSSERRRDAIFEDGFDLQLVDAIAFDSVSNRHLTVDESKKKRAGMQPKLDAALQQLIIWKEDDSIDILSVMQDAHDLAFGHGRAAALFLPGIMDLAPGQLPFRIEIINETDLLEPIVDIGLTKRIVGIKTNFEDKPFCRSDEMVYITRGRKGYRKEGPYYGTASIEVVLAISRSIKRIYNYDIPEAVIAAYITKIIFTVSSEGDPDTQKDRMKEMLREFFTTGKLAFAVTDEVKSIVPIQPKVDTQLIDVLENKLADILLSIVGVPKSMMNREHGLNRDIATVEAIQFIKFIRKPDEKKLAKPFQSQLFDLLLAHLLEMPPRELPVRIKIVRNTPEEGDLDKAFENQANLQQQKTDEIQSNNIKQKDTIFGASGELKKNEQSLQKRLEQQLTQLSRN